MTKFSRVPSRYSRAVFLGVSRHGAPPFDAELERTPRSRSASSVALTLRAMRGKFRAETQRRGG